MSHGSPQEASFDCRLRRSSAHQLAVKRVTHKSKTQQQFSPGERSTIRVQVTVTVLGVPASPCWQILIFLAS